MASVLCEYLKFHREIISGLAWHIYINISLYFAALSFPSALTSPPQHEAASILYCWDGIVQLVRPFIESCVPLQIIPFD